MNKLSNVTASAIMPDQLLPYVKAVSGLASAMAGTCVYHYAAGQAVLAGYPLHDPQNSALVEEAVQILLQKPWLEQITVLSAQPLACAPAYAAISRDAYWKLDLPAAKPKGKLANLLRRASRDVEITGDSWTDAHAQLMGQFCNARKLDAGTQYLFQQLGGYLAEVEGTELYSARDSGDSLKAFAIGDYSALGCAFYMFACRAPDAPPGTSDLLLSHLVERASELGHAQINLGLGINQGIGFFKKKWGAVEFLPYVETSWKIAPARKKGWWTRLFGAG